MSKGLPQTPQHKLRKPVNSEWQVGTLSYPSIVVLLSPPALEDHSVGACTHTSFFSVSYPISLVCRPYVRLCETVVDDNLVYLVTHRGYRRICGTRIRERLHRTAPWYSIRKKKKKQSMGTWSARTYRSCQDSSFGLRAREIISPETSRDAPGAPNVLPRITSRTLRRCILPPTEASV